MDIQFKFIHEDVEMCCSSTFEDCAGLSQLKYELYLFVCTAFSKGIVC